jgi:hypothetical protein
MINLGLSFLGALTGYPLYFANASCSFLSLAQREIDKRDAYNEVTKERRVILVFTLFTIQVKIEYLGGFLFLFVFVKIGIGFFVKCIFFPPRRIICNIIINIIETVFVSHNMVVKGSLP